jgi:hypothetical protein
MLTLDKIEKRYNKNGLGSIAWGGKEYYKINSKKPVLLNSTYSGFILNDKQEVEEFTITTKFKTIKKWGKKLKNYYPWPYYPKKKIKAFEIVRNQPFLKVGEILNLKGNYITYGPITCSIQISKEDCLKWPEFFKPLY